MAGVLSVAGALNLYLCYSWFRTARSNLEYCATRFNQARAIEYNGLVAKTLQLYQQADNELRAGRRRNHSGSAWVRHIPSAFILAWLAVLGAGAGIAYPQGSLSRNVEVNALSRASRETPRSGSNLPGGRTDTIKP